MEKNPPTVMIVGMIEYLWNTLGEGSAAVWRQVGQGFYDEIKESGGDLSTKESAIDAIKNYFIEQHQFAEDVIVEENGDEITVEVKGCAIRPVTDHFGEKGIPRSPCPYANSMLFALENITGDMYIYEKNESADENSCKAYLKKL